MSQPIARILLLADTHLGFDHPARPRVARRRRGPDFFANMERALDSTRAGDVDLVIHGGDLLFRSRVSASLVQQALEPLLAVADRGIPVCLVPGNHERSRIPYPLLARHPRLFVFDRPRTVRLTLQSGLTVAVAGFPFARRVALHFRNLLCETGYRHINADVRLLCMHQAVEGAQVGVNDFTFRGGLDVIPGRAIPSDVAAVLSGHVHRAQTLRRDLRGWPLPAPVVYPGSVERTSFAERLEVKGFVTLRARSGDRPGGELVGEDFVPLPARPMIVLDVEGRGLCPDGLRRAIASALSRVDPQAVVRLRVHGPLPTPTHDVLAARTLRDLAPPTMNLTLADRGQRRGRLRS